MAGLNREHWLAIRATSSFGRMCRERGKLVHLSKPLVSIIGPNGSPITIVTPMPGASLDIGRNKAKRAERQGARKSWRWIGRRA